MTKAQALEIQAMRKGHILDKSVGVTKTRQADKAEK